MFMMFVENPAFSMHLVIQPLFILLYPFEQSKSNMIKGYLSFISWISAFSSLLFFPASSFPLPFSPFFPFFPFSFSFLYSPDYYSYCSYYFAVMPLL